MIIVRRSENRRHIEDQERNTWRTFDWEDKDDFLHKGFGSLQILNEEIFTHESPFRFTPRSNMIIVSYVKQGVVVYHGPLGEGEALEPGDFHRVNVTPDNLQHRFDSIISGQAHIFQSGFTPDTGDLEQISRKKFFTHADRFGVLKLIASPDGRDASLPIDRDVHMYSSLIHHGDPVRHVVTSGRSVWLHVVKGEMRANTAELHTGDGAGFSGENLILMTAHAPSEFLLFDVPEMVHTEAHPEPDKESVLSQTRHVKALQTKAFSSLFREPGGGWAQQ